MIISISKLNLLNACPKLKEMRAKKATIAHLITIKSEKNQISNRIGIKLIYFGSVLLKYKFVYSHYRKVLL